MFLAGHDSLFLPWRGRGFLNPPYGREIGKWLQKALEAAKHDGATVVAIIPARTNAPWWHDFVMRAAEIRFVRKKLAFDGGKGVPVFGSVIAVFRGDSEGAPKISSWRQPQ